MLPFLLLALVPVLVSPMLLFAFYFPAPAGPLSWGVFLLAFLLSM